MPRIIAIWVFGILASAIFGGMIGDLLYSQVAVSWARLAES